MAKKKSSKSNSGNEAEAELKTRITNLENELRTAKEALQVLKGDSTPGSAETDVSSTTSPPTSSISAQPLKAPIKRGYLFRWVDRSIGWTATKWALRFVTLENGKLAYYGDHNEASPRYVLPLRGCAVQDEGYKPNRRHPGHRSGKSVPLEEPGAYFFLFSVYLREDDLPSDEDPTDELLTTKEITPLLRFSTNSSVEQKQWIDLISETCAYCETEEYLEDFDRREEEQSKMAKALPEARRGTLAPMYFSPPTPKINRRPSFSRIPSKKLFRSSSMNLSHKGKKKDGTFNYPPSKPMHRLAAPSYLSVDAPKQNYRGFLNLLFIILVVSNFRLALNAIQQHGFVLWQIIDSFSDVKDLKQDPWEHFPYISGLFVLIAFVNISYVIEVLLSRRQIPESIGMILHYVNAHAAVLFPMWMVWTHVDNPVFGGALLMHATITWMKLVSYAHANEDYRRAVREHSFDMDTHKAALAMVEHLDYADADIVYPQNITVTNIFYFWFAPTLTYQIAFPKYPRIRWLRVLAILMRFIPLGALFYLLGAQIVSPTLDSLVKDLKANGGKYTPHLLAEYWLRLAVTNSYMWLLMFYLFFHLWLNLCAELTRWGDRVFYKDWWNSAEVSVYWRLWNTPVHYWLVRHVYFPCLRMKMSRISATLVVFFLSAVLHEVLVSIPFHMIRPWSFLGMLGQVPLVLSTKFLHKKFPDTVWGNIIFWVSFCIVGQPMAIMLYTVDYHYKKLEASGECSVPGECAANL